MKNKHIITKRNKGMSPLVALILLVSFSVSLGVLVISIINVVLEGNYEVENLCNQVQFEIVNINDKPMLCYNPDDYTFRVLIRNNGIQDLAGFNVAGIGDLNVFYTEMNAKIPSGGVFDRRNPPVDYGFNVGKILEIQLTPKVYYEEEPVPCPNKAQIFKGIPEC